MPGPLRVLIAEDHPLVLEAIMTRLTSTGDIDVVATVDSGEALLEAYDRLAGDGNQPDVVLSDHLLTGTNGIEATRQLVGRHPTARVIILSSLADASVVAAAMAAGAVGYLVKSIPGEELHAKVRAAAAGEAVFDTESAKLMLDAMRQSAQPGREGTKLSARECEVLVLVADGLSNADIAARLFVSPQTVKTHLERIFTKLGVSGRAAAVKKGIEIGAISAH